MSDKLTTSAVVFQSSNLLSQDIDGDNVIMHLDTNEYYGMQSIANRIWQLLEQPIQVEQMVNVLADEYDGELTEIQADVLEFLQSLLDENLIVIQR